MSHPSNKTSNRQPFGVKNQQSAAARAAAAALTNQFIDNNDDGNNNDSIDKNFVDAASKASTLKTHQHSHPQLTPHRSLSTQRTQSNQSQTSETVTTPKKRAVPHEDVHCRNVVEDRDRDSPSKRSRSSKDSSNDDTDPSTGSGLARGMGGVSVETVTSSRFNNPTSATANASKHTNLLVAGSTRPTTKRIDKASRMTEAERLARDRNKLEETRIWRQKYAKAFPGFRFYLDRLDDATKAAVEIAIEQFGGRLEPFFSREVTHVVTSRKTPIHPVAHPDQVDSNQGGSRRPAPMPLGIPQSSRLRAIRSKTERGKNKQAPLHSDRNPFDEPGPKPAPNDLLVKAHGFGMKVWELEKFNKVTSMLRGEDAAAMIEAKPELSQLLKQEKAQGTTERDPATQRGDFYYFGKNANYILVDDATAEHRHIMAREFRRGASKEEPPWPVIYGEIEGRCPFTKFNVTEEDARRRQRATMTTSLRRTVSLSQLNREGTAPPSPRPYNEGFIASNHRAASPYPMASGNSMSVASRMTSQTSQALGSSASFGGAPFDRRLANLGGRFHTPVVGASLPSRSSSASGLGLGAMGGNSPLNSSTTNLNNPDATPGDVARGAMIRRMLGMTEGRPVGMRRALTTGAVRPRRKEKKEGHCENCRQQFSDFDEHVRSSRHKKFARNDRNFIDIDSLIQRVQRPIAHLPPEFFDDAGPIEEMDGSSGVDFNETEATWQDYQEGIGQAISGSGSESRQPEEDLEGSGYSEYYHGDAAAIDPASIYGDAQISGSSRGFTADRRVATPDTSPNVQASAREAKAEAGASAGAPGGLIHVTRSQKLFKSLRK